jgi:hypothetical protein
MTSVKATKQYRERISTDFEFLSSKADNFWRHVSVGKPTECWNWLGKTVKANVGPVGSWNDITAPRIAIELDTGILLGHETTVKHKEPCNSLCCNPSHLLLHSNWVHDSKCIGCGVHYQLKPLVSCSARQHLDYFRRLPNTEIA